MKNIIKMRILLQLNQTNKEAMLNIEDLLTMKIAKHMKICRARMTQDKRVVRGKRLNYEEGVRWYIDE